MSVFRRLWSGIVGFIEAMESAEDPAGDYLLALGSRVERLEGDIESLKGQLSALSIPTLRD